jgi:hypothetical protein
VYITLPLIRPAIVARRHHAHDGRAVRRSRPSTPQTGGGPGTADRDPEPVRVPHVVPELNLGYGAALAMVLLVVTLACRPAVPPAQARA